MDVEHLDSTFFFLSLSFNVSFSLTNWIHRSIFFSISFRWEKDRILNENYINNLFHCNPKNLTYLVINIKDQDSHWKKKKKNNCNEYNAMCAF